MRILQQKQENISILFFVDQALKDSMNLAFNSLDGGSIEIP